MAKQCLVQYSNMMMFIYLLWKDVSKASVKHQNLCQTDITVNYIQYTAVYPKQNLKVKIDECEY